ncbi:MAG: hypothetical protein PHW00_03415 [Clostridia bacterium]|nr:hypothetical protein [Clostridia bacterium]
MRKQLEKIVLIAQIVVGLLIMLISLLIVTTLGDGVGFFDNVATNVILLILIIIFVLLSIYLLMCTFSHNGKVKKLTLYQQKDTLTQTTAKVVEGLIKDCIAQCGGVRVKKIKIIETDTGVVLRLSVAVAHDNVSHSIGKLRQTIEDTFFEVFAIDLESIDFLIVKLAKKRIVKDTQAPTQSTQQEQPTQDIDEQPIQQDSQQEQIDNQPTQHNQESEESPKPSVDSQLMQSKIEQVEAKEQQLEQQLEQIQQQGEQDEQAKDAQNESQTDDESIDTQVIKK